MESEMRISVMFNDTRISIDVDAFQRVKDVKEVRLVFTILLILCRPEMPQAAPSLMEADTVCGATSPQQFWCRILVRAYIRKHSGPGPRVGVPEKQITELYTLLRTYHLI